ncbi:MAG: cytochrome c [Acidobacteria bacterium]|nr:cytochrome c [Acidobacteriota bacterium]
MRLQPPTRLGLGLALGLLIAAPTAASAQDAAAFFKQNCTSCHTIGGGRLTGPDLKDVTKSRDRAWLTDFVLAPQAALDRGDPYALQLQQEARGVVMPQVAGINRDLVSALLDLIEAESALPKSQFAGVQVSDRPFTAADVQLGTELFRGQRRLGGGGPSCVSCHTVRGTGGLGGGQLGPDLTKVYERLQWRKALATWLNAPPTATMQTVFAKTPIAETEVLPLVAYFEAAARNGGEDDRAGLIQFVLLGLGAAALGLGVMDSAWKTRFRSVRRALVERRRGARS